MEQVESIRITSRPVRRTLRRGAFADTAQVGPVEVAVEMEWGLDGRQVRHGVFPLPTGGTGVVLRLDDEGEEWLASAGGPWLPEVFDGLHPAVFAAIEYLAMKPTVQGA